MLKYKAKQYFKLFSDKNIQALSSIFSKKITLRDWKIKSKGLKSVLKANAKIFKNCKSIHVKPLKIFKEKKTIIAELVICINKSKNLLVIDVIEFDKKNKIKSIRAYLGN
jgi:hypothetical protein